MIKKALFVLLTAVSTQVSATNRIKYYFSRPVDNSVSTGMNAIYLNNSMADTIVAYVNRAKYSIDIAQSEYISGSFANITTAVNAAYSRGVNIRWIYDGSMTNTGMSGLNSAINKVASPTGGIYGLMHDKFMVIDAYSTTPEDAIVITGSFDWNYYMFATDYNNAIIIQDSAMAHAYTNEFNMMWGSTGLTPNSSLAKFGPDKTDLGQHMFNIDGTVVELYFSPSDGTDSKIQSCINTANVDLYFAMYTFTSGTDASLIMARHSAGVYVAGIDDQYSHTYSPYSTFTSGLGTNFIEYTGTEVYHNKYLVVDPSDACSDPQVLTGSHNWTTSANTKNDENTLIIHDGFAANVYYQAFKGDFNGLGGTLVHQNGCLAGVDQTASLENELSIFPNPNTGSFNIRYTLNQPQQVTISLCSIDGRYQGTLMSAEQQAGAQTQTFTTQPGIYILRLTTATGSVSRKLVVE